MGKRIILIIIGLLIVAVIGLVGYFIYRQFFGGSGTLTVWTIQGNEDAVRAVVERYTQQNRAYRVRIVPLPQQAYEFTSLFALAAEEGPDVWIVPNEWMALHHSKLVPAPDGVLDQGIQQYEKERERGEADPFPLPAGRSNLDIITDDYAPIARQDLVRDNQVYGVPLTMDTLALFYDRTRINQPPKTWQEVVDLTKRFTQRSGNTVTRSTIALGDHESVTHAIDTLSILMLQNGVSIVDQDTNVATFNVSPTGQTPPGTTAFDFFLSFAEPGRETYTWNRSFGQSLQALAEGRTMMALGYASDLAAVGSSGQTRIETAPLPQVNTDKPQTYGRYLAATVTKQSQQSEQAWNLVSYFANPDIILDYATSLGVPPARKDVAAQITLDAQYKTFLDQVPQATNWQKAEVGVANGALNEAFELAVDNNERPQTALDVASKAYTAFLQRDTGIVTDEDVMTLWQSTEDPTNYSNVTRSYLGVNEALRRVAISQHEPDRFEWEVINAMAAGQGPDLLLLPNDHVTRFQPTLRAFPRGSFNFSNERADDALAIERTFIPAVVTDNFINGRLYGMPLHIESLMIAYNNTLLRQITREKIDSEDPAYEANEKLFDLGPVTWDDLKTMASIATKKNGTVITQPFLALGRGSNVDHAEDVMAVLVKQLGGEITDPDRLVTGIHLPVSSQDRRVPGQQALELIQSFSQSSSPHYTWNDSFPNSLQALTESKVVAAFIYPRDLAKIQAANPLINLRFYPLPQQDITGEPIDFASYYTFTIPKASRLPQAALAMIRFAMTENVDRDLQSPRQSNTDRPILERQGNPQAFQKNTAESYYKGPNPEEIDQTFRQLLDNRFSLEQAANRMNQSLKKTIL